MPSAILKTKNLQRVQDIGGSAAGARSGAFIDIADIEPTRATSGGFSSQFMPAAEATDVFRPVGSATKPISLKSIYVRGSHRNGAVMVQ